MTDDERLAQIRKRNLDARELAQRHGDEYPTQDAAEIGFLLDALDEAKAKNERLKGAGKALYEIVQDQSRWMDIAAKVMGEEEWSAIKTLRAANAALDRVRDAAMDVASKRQDAARLMREYAYFDGMWDAYGIAERLVRDALRDHEEGK